MNQNAVEGGQVQRRQSMVHAKEISSPQTPAVRVPNMPPFEPSHDPRAAKLLELGGVGQNETTFSFPADQIFWQNLVTQIKLCPEVQQGPLMEVDASHDDRKYRVNRDWLYGFVNGWKKDNPYIVTVQKGGKDTAFYASEEFWSRVMALPPPEAHQPALKISNQLPGTQVVTSEGAWDQCCERWEAEKGCSTQALVSHFDALQRQAPAKVPPVSSSSPSISACKACCSLAVRVDDLERNIRDIARSRQSRSRSPASYEDWDRRLQEREKELLHKQAVQMQSSPKAHSTPTFIPPPSPQGLPQYVPLPPAAAANSVNSEQGRRYLSSQHPNPQRVATHQPSASSVHPSSSLSSGRTPTQQSNGRIRPVVSPTRRPPHHGSSTSDSHPPGKGYTTSSRPPVDRQTYSRDPPPRPPSSRGGPDQPLHPPSSHTPHGNGHPSVPPPSSRGGPLPGGQSSRGAPTSHPTGRGLAVSSRPPYDDPTARPPFGAWGRSPSPPPSPSHLRLHIEVAHEVTPRRSSPHNSYQKP